MLALTLLAWPLRRAAAGAGRGRRHLPHGRRPAGRRRAPTPYDGRAARRHPVPEPVVRPVLARRARHHGRSPDWCGCSPSSTCSSRSSRPPPAAHLHGGPLPAASPRGRTGPGRRGRRAAAPAPDLELPAPEGPADRAVDSALRHAAEPSCTSRRPRPAQRRRPARPARRAARPRPARGAQRAAVRHLLALRPAARPVHRPRAGPGVTGPGAALVLGRADRHLRPEARLRLGLLPGGAARAGHGGGAGRRGRRCSPRCRAAGGTCR